MSEKIDRVPTFDAKRVKTAIIEWIRNWFDKNGQGCNAVIGISGGKDSSIVAALCVQALGRERVIGVLMPQGIQSDINCSKDLVEHLGIKSFTVNIGPLVDASMNEIRKGIGMSVPISEQTIINIPPRVRMTVLYAVSQSNNGRVSNNCNLSEDWVGYVTRFGDSVGDFSPLSDITVTEVKLLGKELGLPQHLIEKPPADGLCAKTDEDNLGFSYEVLDRYIRTGEIEDKKLKERIDIIHERNLFKLELMPKFEYIPE